jgi:hypothetical protein
VSHASFQRPSASKPYSWRRLSYATTLLIFAMVTWTNFARAGLLDDSMTYDIRVVDENSRGIEGATVWVLGDDVMRTDLRPEDLARLVKRYAPDADFVFGNNLHGELLVLRTSRDGTVRLKNEDTEVGGLKRIHASFAGLKRGYLPAQVDDISPNNAHRHIVLRLKRDSTADIDPRMAELDMIRAQAWQQWRDPMSAERDRTLRELESRLRSLASALEKDGRMDDAAALYYNLAYLPSVDIERNESGVVIARGYTNGFDDRAPRRVADRKRAWQLATAHPILEYDAMLDSYKARGLMVMAHAKDAPLREEYIADTEALIRRYGERLWPSVHLLLERAYVANGNFEAGCRSLRARHDFEPSLETAEGWNGLVGLYQAGVKLRGGPAKAECVLADVPPSHTPG